MKFFLRISCVNTSGSNNQDKRITHVGGLNSDGTKWKLTEQQALKGIENGTHSFYVVNRRKMVNVVIASNKFGNKYLTTESSPGENLLFNLPECK